MELYETQGILKRPGFAVDPVSEPEFGMTGPGVYGKGSAHYGYNRLVN